MFSSWTYIPCITILCALCFVVQLVQADEMDDKSILVQTNQNEKNRRNSDSEKFVVALNIELRTKQRELDRLKKEYKKLAIDLKVARKKLLIYDIQVSALLNKGKIMTKDDLLFKAISNQKKLAEGYEILRSQLELFSKTLNRGLQNVELTFREKTLKQFSKIMKEVKDLSILHQASSQKAVNVETCFVVKINLELEIVVLSEGSLKGLKVGEIWESKDGTQEIKIIETGKILCLGSVIKGKLKNIVPGATFIKR